MVIEKLREDLNGNGKMNKFEINKSNILNKKSVLIEYDAGYISPKDNRHFVNEVNKLTEGRPIIEEPLLVYAVMQKYGVENRNERVYPEAILKREAENYLKLIKEKRALGEADHPESSIVAVSRISHNVVDLWWEGNVLMGKLEIIMSPGFVNQGIISCEGDRVANYLRKGLKIGVSSRGVGSLEKEGGKNVVQDDYELICWDIVTSPSTPGSWIYSEEPSREQQMSESKTKKDTELLKDNLSVNYSAQPMQASFAEATLNRLEAEWEAARLLTIKAAWLADNKIPNSKEASMAKAKAGRVANEVTLKCVELCGALGYSEDELLEKWSRDSKILDIFEGTQQIQLLIVARRVLNKSSAELK